MRLYAPGFNLRGVLYERRREEWGFILIGVSRRRFRDIFVYYIVTTCNPFCAFITDCFSKLLVFGLVNLGSLSIQRRSSFAWIHILCVCYLLNIFYESSLGKRLFWDITWAMLKTLWPVEKLIWNFSQLFIQSSRAWANYIERHCNYQSRA